MINKGRLAALLISGLSLNLAVPVQIAIAAEGRVIEEIVVQARRQNETLQDVPVSITSVGGEQLTNFQMDQVGEIAERIPNFNVQTGGSGSGGTVNLRGVGSSAISAAFDSAVALDIDGVTVSRMRMVQSAFLDLKQVDVLKGPQSLYFGKSASAGVVAFQSANPGEELEAKLSAGYDFGLEGYFVDGFVSGPISENLGARLAVRYSESDEIWRNEAPGRPEENGEEDLSARLTLAWQASDNVNVNFKSTITSHEADEAIGNTDILCAVPGDPQTSSFAGQNLPGGYDCDHDDGVSQVGGHNALFAQNVAGRKGLSPYEELDTSITRLQIEWDINKNLTLTSVSGYFDLEEEGASCYGYDTRGIGCNHTVNETEAFSQELRLAGNISESVSFLLGAFYQDRELLFDTSQEAVGGANLAPLFGLPSIDPATGFTDDWRKIHATDSETKSIFASVTVQASDRLEVTAGVRYSEDERTQAITVPHVHYMFDVLALNFVPNGFESGDIDFDDTNTSPELSLLYVLNDDINLYAAYKSGYKAGGVDNSALPSSSLATAAATGDFGALIYETEEGDGFELGLKGKFLDNSVRLDVTAFRYTYEDLQVQSFDGTSIQFRTSNAGELVSQGLEADFTWLPAVDGLTVYGAVSILDAAFSDSFTPTPPDGVFDPAVLALYDLDGQSTSGAADFALNAGLDYSAPMDGGLEWGFGLNASYSDEYETQNEDPDGFVQDSFVLLNARVFVGAQDGKWKVSVSGRNLNDELYVVTTGDRPFADSSNNTLKPGGVGRGDSVLNYARGRQVFLEFEVRM